MTLENINKSLKDIRFLSITEEVSLNGSNACLYIADAVTKKGADLPSYKMGYTSLQSIAEAIDWAYNNKELFPSYNGGRVLFDGHSGDYVLMKDGKILYCILGRGCWVAARFESK